ncbi:CHAT domain-containing protein [Lacinutrix sp. MEBiC02404]
MKKLVFLFFILSFCELFAQQTENKEDSLLTAYKKQNKLTKYAELAHDISLTYNKKGDFNKALKYGLLEVKFKKHLSLERQKNSLFNLGLFFFKTKNYGKSIEAYNKVIDSFSIDEKTYRAYCENARNHIELGDYFQAVNYFKKGLEIPEKLTTKRLPGIYLNYIELNHKITNTKSIAENKRLLKIVDSLSTITTLSATNLYSLNNEYGIFYKSDFNYNFNKSRYYYLKNLKKDLENENQETIASSYNNLGVLYNKEKKDSALFYINKGIEYAKKDTDISRLYINKAEYYFNIGKTKDALKILQQALQLTVPTKIDSAIIFSPNFKALASSKNKTLSLLILKEKSKYILENTALSKDKKMLQVAYETISLADKLIDVIRMESNESQSKLLWQEEASETFMLGVKACFKLNKPEEAFYFIEKNKALLLLENIKQNRLRLSSKIPSEILQKEQDFKKDIFAIENELNKNFNKALKDEYHSLKIEYNSFKESLVSTYPEYYSSKQTIAVTTIDVIKNSLDGNTTILEYIVNKEEGFLLTITKNSVRLFKLNDTESLETEINKYLKLLQKPLNTSEELKNYKKLSQQLCSYLFPFKDKDILKNKLIIVSDYTLQNLPFESLKKDNRYLIEDFEISYTYSLSFLEKNKKLNRDAKQELIAFAPKSFTYDNLKTLPRSEDEAKTISQLLNGKVFVDTSANKTNFFKEINKYKIIHLATHANANDSISPWIAFKNNKLYLNELYTTKNQAELVVLNACNSSLGEIKSGEGVFSLARGFFYSGANSVISSLWNVNDKSNAAITTSFYKYVKDGKTKSASLRQAKLDYLHSHSLSETSPYYWSTLILIGDNSAIYSGNNTLYYIILSVFLFIFLFFILKKLKIVGNKS